MSIINCSQQNVMAEAVNNDKRLKDNGKVQLKQELGLLSSVGIIVGSIIGSGIFISPIGVLSNTGSIGLSLVVWTSCGIISTLGALAFAELGTSIPKSGAEYAYLYEAFGSLPAFVFAWVKIFANRPSSQAVVCLTFSEYALSPFFDACGPPLLIKKLLAASVLALLGAINCYGVKAVAKIQVVFTGLKLLALSIIIMGGVVHLSKGNLEYFDNAFSGSTDDPSKIALAFYSGFWAFGGWNYLNLATEEVKDPTRTLPRAIWISLPLVTIFYLLTNISYFAVISKTELLASTTTGVLWGNKVLGVASILIPISVAVSTFGAANGTTFVTSRVAYAAARNGHMPKVLSMINVKRRTPLPSIILSVTLSILMLIPGDIFSLISFLSFTSWLFIGGSMLALLVLRWTRPTLHRPFKVPLVIPIIMVAVTLFLVITPITKEPKIEFLYAILFVIVGLLLYIPFVCCRHRWNHNFLDKFTVIVQLVMESTAPYEFNK